MRTEQDVKSHQRRSRAGTSGPLPTQPQTRLREADRDARDPSTLHTPARRRVGRRALAGVAAALVVVGSAWMLSPAGDDAAPLEPPRIPSEHDSWRQSLQHAERLGAAETNHDPWLQGRLRDEAREAEHRAGQLDPWIRQRLAE